MVKTIYLAGGCFWGTARLFSLVNGVSGTEVGYANSLMENPDYRTVCTGVTNAAETVKVDYDPDCVSLQELIDLYVRSIDPTLVNRQGGDSGTQYRTGIYYTSAEDGMEVEEAMRTLDRELGGRLAVEYGPLVNFYPAEEYHQDYLEKNPGGYCHVNPALFREARNVGRCGARAGKEGRRFERPDDASLRRNLTPLQWEVTQNAATEPPYINKYDREFSPGIYVDVTTGEPLFLSVNKYASGCGWPAFTRPISARLIEEREDTSHGMQRVEVRAAHSGAHLGHLFPDGPVDEGGMRYCINSASLRFIPLEKMQEEGYGDYIPLLGQE